MTDKEEKRMHQTPDFTNEEFWREFNQQLWLLAKESESSEINSDEESTVATDIVSPENSRKKDCLSFERYNEIAEQPTSITVAEKIHLEHCRYCTRRIASFSELLLQSVQHPEVSAKTTWRKWLLSKRLFLNTVINREIRLSLSPAKVVLATLAIILVGGLAFMLIQSGLLWKNETASLQNKNPQNQNLQNQVNSNLPNTNSTNSPSSPKTPLIKPNKKTVKPKKSESPIQSNEEQAKNSLSEKANQRQVRESLKTGVISLDGSDLEKLQEVTTRSVNDSNIKPISPKNEAVLETSPSFHWQGTDNFEYKIVVTYLDLNKVAESKTISQNNVRIEKELSPGFYFWRIEKRQKGEETPFEPVPGLIIFKVSSEKEKLQIESAGNSTKSNLVRAILYARAGLLEQSEVELKAELVKNPNSSKAKKMLAQVQGWRRK
jgi:hypothetical protein